MAAPDVKLCPHCDKKLRADNTRGACSRCLAEGRGKPTGDEAPPASEKSRATRTAEALKEFRAVAKLLGIDGEKLLADFANGWVHQVRERAKALVEEV